MTEKRIEASKTGDEIKKGTVRQDRQRKRAIQRREVKGHKDTKKEKQDRVERKQQRKEAEEGDMRTVMK